MVPAGAVATDVRGGRRRRPLCSCRSVTTRSCRRTSGRCRWPTCRSRAGSRRRRGRRRGEAFEAAVDDWLVLTAAALGRHRAAVARDRRRVRRRSARRSARRIGAFQAHRPPPGRLAPPPSTAPGCSPTRRRGPTTADPSRFARAGGRWRSRFAAETARDASYRSCTSTAATASCWSTTSSSTTAAAGHGRRVRHVPEPRLPAGRGPSLRRSRPTLDGDRVRGGGGRDDGLPTRVTRIEALRAEVREFLDEHMTHELEEQHVPHRRVATTTDFTTALVEQGWLAPGWPGRAGRRRAATRSSCWRSTRSSGRSTRRPTASARR